MKRFKYIFRVITTVILLNLTASGASAQSIDYDSIEVSLLTCSPGQEVWAQYGHTALRWHDLNPEHCIDVVVNYGVFSSSQPYFIPRFIFGLTDYCVGALPYDEFYKMSHNNRKSTNNNKKKLNNNFMENIPENSRIKKEREKMKGHKCELCQKFYDCVNESDDFLCQECSRHRTDQPINKTPQGFYDLNI